jgi:ATP-dependent Zn protease
MATVAEPVGGLRRDETTELARQWRRLIWVATLIAFLTSPVPFAFFYYSRDISLGWSLFLTFLVVIAFRGSLDLIFRRTIPWPSLFGTDEDRLKQDDITNRRRAWFWFFWFRVARFVVVVITVVWLIRVLKGDSTTWWGTAGDIWGVFTAVVSNPQALIYAVMLPLFLLFNFVILMGPLMLMGITQIQAFEPGDADWGVRLADVRGQAEAKEEVRRVVNLWQSGEAFESAGGKRERGLLMLGAPGTGKTMLSKAIATGFNSPFVSIPGSGFAQTFIGMDAVIVRFLARKARRLARKWGGQCIIFIDEIDAVGMRRASLGQGQHAAPPASFHDYCFYGPNGSLTPTGDLILETRAWRERLFAQRAPETRSPYPPFVQRLAGIVNQAFPGMFGGQGGGLALNQLLVVMDGIGNPRFSKKVMTNRINSFLDATYIVPSRIGKVSLRLPPPGPSPEQIYFIGACNVPIEMLDPALTRPGRMGRHVWFRTPTKQDRLDIFDLYINKVAHTEDLDQARRRDELARITNGYSPAMIEQVCSMALTHAHHDARARFDWDDIVEAMTTVESGTAVNIEYVPHETRAVAIHEAGHAVCSHAYMQGAESTRISIRRRGQALGHHQALQKEERFSAWQSEQMSQLVWGLGAMAAERVFYNENSTGVGGDVQTATSLAAWMVGACAMGPEPIELGNSYTRAEFTEDARERIEKRFQKIGNQILNRTSGGPMTADPIASVLGDPEKRRAATILLGQAYVKAHALVEHNRPAVEHVADVLVEKREIHGDEVIELLDSLNLQIPEVDLLEERTWPKI